MKAKAAALFSSLWQGQDSPNYDNESLVSELPGSGALLKTLIPGPIPNLLYQNLWVWDPGIWISKKFPQMTLISTDIEDHCFKIFDLSSQLN